jgi:hypothetical protein
MTPDPANPKVGDRFVHPVGSPITVRAVDGDRVHYSYDGCGGGTVNTTPRAFARVFMTPPATAQVYPVLAAITQAPAWGVSVDGRLVATCGREDDAHTLRRLINEAGGL